MSEYNLNLFEDRLEVRGETTWPLAEGYRIIYLVAPLCAPWEARGPWSDND